MRYRRFALATVLLAGLIGLAGCEEEPAEEAAEQVGEAADEAGDALEETAENMEDAVE